MRISQIERKILLSALVVIGTSICIAQVEPNCDGCTIELNKAIRAKEIPNDWITNKFFECFNKECEANAEMGPILNFSLFIFIQNHPDQYNRLIENQKDIYFIKKNLENPVIESININATINALKSLEKINYKTKLSLEILESIK